MVKLSFYPVLSQFRFALGDMITKGITINGLEDVLHWHVVPAQVEDRIVLRIIDGNKNEIITHNPLAIAIALDNRTHSEVVDKLFRDFVALIHDQRSMTLREFVTARADYRNKLLYAEDAGYREMDEDLRTLIDTVFRTTLSDLLWTLAVLLTNPPVLRDWGLVSQFISLYRRVLIESGVMRPDRGPAG